MGCVSLYDVTCLHADRQLQADDASALPLGSYLLVGVLITNGATRALDAMYPVMIDDEGVHVSSPQPIHRLDMLCQGEIEQRRSMSA